MYQAFETNYEASYDTPWGEPEIIENFVRGGPGPDVYTFFMNGVVEFTRGTITPGLSFRNWAEFVMSRYHTAPLFRHSPVEPRRALLLVIAKSGDEQERSCRLNSLIDSFKRSWRCASAPLIVASTFDAHAKRINELRRPFEVGENSKGDSTESKPRLRSSRSGEPPEGWVAERLRFSAASPSTTNSGKELFPRLFRQMSGSERSDSARPLPSSRKSQPAIQKQSALALTGGKYPNRTALGDTTADIGASKDKTTRGDNTVGPRNDSLSTVSQLAAGVASITKQDNNRATTIARRLADPRLRQAPGAPIDATSVQEALGIGPVTLEPSLEQPEQFPRVEKTPPKSAPVPLVEPATKEVSLVECSAPDFIPFDSDSDGDEEGSPLDFESISYGGRKRVLESPAETRPTSRGSSHYTVWFNTKAHQDHMAQNALEQAEAQSNRDVNYAGMTGGSSLDTPPAGSRGEDALGMMSSTSTQPVRDGLARATRTRPEFAWSANAFPFEMDGPFKKPSTRSVISGSSTRSKRKGLHEDAETRSEMSVATLKTDDWAEIRDKI